MREAGKTGRDRTNPNANRPFPALDGLSNGRASICSINPGHPGELDESGTDVAGFVGADGQQGGGDGLGMSGGRRNSVREKVDVWTSF